VGYRFKIYKEAGTMTPAGYGGQEVAGEIIDEKEGSGLWLCGSS
jgi:hypothetical protein